MGEEFRVFERFEGVSKAQTDMFLSCFSQSKNVICKYSLERVGVSARNVLNNWVWLAITDFPHQQTG